MTKLWKAIPLSVGIAMSFMLLWGVSAKKARTDTSSYLVSPSPYTDQPGGTIYGSTIRTLWYGSESYQYRIWCTSGKITILTSANKTIEEISSGNSIDVEGAGLQVRGTTNTTEGTYIRID